MRSNRWLLAMFVVMASLLCGCKVFDNSSKGTPSENGYVEPAGAKSFPVKEGGEKSYPQDQEQPQYTMIPNGSGMSESQSYERSDSGNYERSTYEKRKWDTKSSGGYDSTKGRSLPSEIEEPKSSPVPQGDGYAMPE